MKVITIATTVVCSLLGGRGPVAIPSVTLPKEKLHRTRVQLERDGFQEGDVIPEHLVVLEIEVLHDDLVHVVVAEEKVDGLFTLDILCQNAKRL